MSKYEEFVQDLKKHIGEKYPEHVDVADTLTDLADKVLTVEREIETKLEEIHDRICKGKDTICSLRFMSRMHKTIIDMAIIRRITE